MGCRCGMLWTYLMFCSAELYISFRRWRSTVDVIVLGIIYSTSLSKHCQKHISFTNHGRQLIQIVPAGQGNLGNAKSMWILY